MNSLAALYRRQGRFAEAEPLFRRALAIYEKAAGPEHPAAATLLSNLGQVLKVEGRYDEAEPLIRRLLAIHEKAQGKDHPDTARSLKQSRRSLSAPAPLCRRQAFVQARPCDPRTGVGSDHRETATFVNNLAALYRDEGHSRDALPLVERMIAAERAQLHVALPVLSAAAEQQLLPNAMAPDEALDAIQHAAQSQAAAAVNRLAARLAAGTDRFADLVRRDQDFATEADALGKAIIAAVSGAASKRDAAAESCNKARLAAITVERAALQKTLAVEFLDCAALSKPLLIKTAEIQSLLS
jgi:tetratricopeptide (TPR) repeat protein